MSSSSKLHRFYKGGWNAMSAKDTAVYYDGAWHDPCSGTKTLWHYKDGAWHKFPCGELIYFNAYPNDWEAAERIQAVDVSGAILTHIPEGVNSQRNGDLYDGGYHSEPSFPSTVEFGRIDGTQTLVQIVEGRPTTWHETWATFNVGSRPSGDLITLGLGLASGAAKYTLVFDTDGPTLSVFDNETNTQLFTQTNADFIGGGMRVQDGGTEITIFSNTPGDGGRWNWSLIGTVTIGASFNGSSSRYEIDKTGPDSFFGGIYWGRGPVWVGLPPAQDSKITAFTVSTLAFWDQGPRFENIPPKIGRA